MVVPKASLTSRTSAMDTLARLTERRDEMVLLRADLGAVTGAPLPLARWDSHVRAEPPSPASARATAAGASFCRARKEVTELITRAGLDGRSSGTHGSSGGATAPTSAVRSNSEAINSPPA